jgi:hypothetical protein
VFFLAEKLGRTVEELSVTMSAEEFGGWLAEFALRNDAQGKRSASDTLPATDDGAVALSGLRAMGVV